MTFTFPNDPHGDHITLFKNTQLTLNTGITILVGCNGSGKTTLLRLIKKECEQNEIPYLSFDNKRAALMLCLRQSFTAISIAFFALPGIPRANRSTSA